MSKNEWRNARSVRSPRPPTKMSKWVKMSKAGYGAGWPKVVHRLYGTIPEDRSWEFCDFCMPRPFLKVCLAAADETCSSCRSHQMGNKSFHQNGVPEFIHSDNGKQFVSEIFGELMTRYGIRHVKTGLYSPQANTAERVNRSVLQILRATIATG